MVYAGSKYESPSLTKIFLGAWFLFSQYRLMQDIHYPPCFPFLAPSPAHICSMSSWLLHLPFLSTSVSLQSCLCRHAESALCLVTFLVNSLLGSGCLFPHCPFLSDYLNAESCSSPSHNYSNITCF